MWDKAEILKNVAIRVKTPEENAIFDATLVPKVGSGVKFTYKSKHLEEGYPGEVIIEVSYLITADKELFFHWQASLSQG